MSNTSAKKKTPEIIVSDNYDGQEMSGEYVDIVTWERFKSWHHVEKDSPVRLTAV